MNWNRQYRPKQVKDLHLTSVRTYLVSLLNSGNFPQVFLFAGPKGTGKTSTARIIAALLNDPINTHAVQNIFFEKKSAKLQEPSAEHELTKRIFTGSSYVVHELDAASNRGIDDVRALKERVGLPPQEGVMTVYILDEVHMLTTEAFNALLKLLEEPPPHVIFILATTEIDKIPATIVSRAQLLRFTKASTSELTAALQNILSQEKLKSEPAVLEAIADRADGSFRDAVKLLEMISQVGPITTENAATILQLSLQLHVRTLVEKLLAKDAAGVVQTFEQLRSSQVNAKLLHTQLLTYLHEELLKALGVHAEPAVVALKSSQFLLKELSDYALSSPSPIPLLQLELKFLEVIDRSQKKSVISAPVPPEPTPVSQAPKKKIIESTSMNEKNLVDGDGNAICEHWQELISQAIDQNFGLATLLKAAKPISGELGKVTVSVYYKFHQEQLMQPKFKKLIDTLFTTVAGGRVLLECTLVEEPVGAELADRSEGKNLAELAVASLM